MKSKCEVTIICMAYNQVDYIADALQGFVSQRTTFEYEVIVNDDCSTDGTAEIIRSFADQYPDLIVPIFHDKNQRGKIDGKGVVRYCIEKLAKGRYVALCEGDDYWISEEKLQKQYDFLEGHADYSICGHNAIIANQLFDVAYLSESNDADVDKDMTSLIIEGGGLVNPTASLFFRKQYYDYWQSGPVGDHFVLMTLAKHGKMRWMAEPMSVYRFRSKGSWSNDAASYDPQRFSAYRSQYVSALKWMDGETNFVYHAFFEKRISMQVTEADDRIMEARYYLGESGMRNLLEWCGFKTALKCCLKKNNAKLYYFAGRCELLAKAHARGALVARHLSNCSQISPLAIR